MLTFTLTCGALTSQVQARTMAEAFDQGFTLYGHSGHAITCLCQRNASPAPAI